MHMTWCCWQQQKPLRLNEQTGGRRKKLWNKSQHREIKSDENIKEGTTDSVKKSSWEEMNPKYTQPYESKQGRTHPEKNVLLY